MGAGSLMNPAPFVRHNTDVESHFEDAPDLE